MVFRDLMLLDTHALLWWVTGDGRLSPTVREAMIEQGGIVSVVSLWEIAIKRDLGRIEVELSMLIDEIRGTEGFRLLDVTADHVLAASRLPKEHGDPFDRMLVAQALSEQVPLASRDRSMRAYAVDLVW